MRILQFTSVLAFVALTITCGEETLEPAKLRLGNLPASVSSVPLGHVFKHHFSLLDADTTSRYLWQTIVTDLIPSGKFEIDSAGLFQFFSDTADSGKMFGFRVLVLVNSEIVVSHDFTIRVDREAPLILRLVSLSRSALLGLPVEVSLIKVSGDLRFEGSEFCFAYDSQAVKPELATIGPDVGVDGCDWEYFTYRFYDGLHSNPLRPNTVLVAMIADVNNGAAHPNCTQVPDGAELARIRFRVNSDPSLLCSSSPLEFLWFDCGSNSVSVSGTYVDTFYIGTTVMSDSWDGTYPLTADRVQTNDCDSSYQPSLSGFCERYRADCHDYPTSDRLIFWNGAISFVCPDSIDVSPR